MRSYTRMKAAAAVAAVALLATACGGEEADNGDDDAAAGDQEMTEEETDGGEDAGGEGEGEGGTLSLGYILPETGDPAFLGPPPIQATNYAIQQINDAGGVLGNEIPDPVAGDEANDQAVANQPTDRVLAADVNGIIGAAASGMSLAIIDKITSSGVAQCSGSNTAPTFTDYEDNGLYFRTAPSDALQGPVLADTIVADGWSNVAIVARADDYGVGLADATAEALESAGATVVMNETYDTRATDFNATVQNIVSADPDAVVVIAFEEGAQILQGLIEAGITAETTGLYGADGLRSADLPNLVSPDNPAALAGMKGTAPASADNEDFVTGLQEFAPDLEELQFAPPVYDCVMVMALAAEAAGSVDAEEFKSEVNSVTKDGETCTTFADCKALLDEGEDIDYDGVSGPLDFIDVGEPGVASIEVYTYNESGELETVEVVESNPAE